LPALTLCVHRRPRRGLTLLEVILALAIFLFSMVALGRLISFGSDRAREIQGRANQLCQAKLAEVASGITPLQSADGTFEEDPDWHWSIECQENGIQALWNVKVTVSRKLSDGSAAQAVLTQMVFDPNQRGSSLDPTRLASSTSGGSSDGSGSSQAAPSAAPSVMGGSAMPFAGPLSGSPKGGAGAAKPSGGGGMPSSTAPRGMGGKP
jgi:prepilin-type N-terminal cleavage/methylation domain-containing protein